FWALKKGDDAVLDQSTKFIAVVRNEQSVEGLPPEKRKRIYHAVNITKGAGPATTTGLGPTNNSFRPTPIRHR
ncbi:MAG: hypothetical protein ACRD9S_22510, partial [Pyrinomonadaceae bacterium]